MYGKGYKLEGSKNGRSKKFLIFTPWNEIFYCNGTYKKFCEEYCKEISPNPARKYFKEIRNKDKEIEGWYIKEIENEEELENYNYTIYF